MSVRKRYGRRAPVAVAALCALLAGAADAESLDDAWRAAIAADDRLAAAESRAAAAAADADAARAERLPRVTATTSVSRWNDPPTFDFGAAGVPAVLPIFPGNTLRQSTAHLSLPVYTAGALRANVAAADAAAAGQNSAAEALHGNVKLGVAAAYIGVLRAESALAVASTSTGSLSAHARDVEDMRRAGQVPSNDYLAAAVSLADVKQRELAAQSDLGVAQAVYNRAVGRPLDAPVALDPLTLPVVERIGARSLEQLLAEAREARPELAELHAAAAAWNARADAVRASRLPQLSVEGGYAFLENSVLNRRDFWFVGVGVRWNVFDSGRTRHARAALERRSAAAAADSDGLDTAIELEVRSAWLSLGAARARIDVAMSAVAQADENLRVVRDRYRNGEGTNTEVLDAETLRAQSAGNLDAARYDTALAELTLARAAGVL